MIYRVLFVLILVAVGGVGYWLIAPLVIDTEVQDTLDDTFQARLEAQRQYDARQQTEELAATTTPDSETTTPQEEASAQDFGIVTYGPFAITGTPGHPASGQIEVITSPEENVVYYKNYDGTNGPDLRVYLATDLEATEFIDLGPAKGNQGNLIYGIPTNVDLSTYRYVLTWCRAFSELFDYARLQ